MIFPKSKSFDFGIFKPPNIAKLKGYFKLNHFSNRFFMISDSRLGHLLKGLFNISVSSPIVFS